MEKFNKSQYMLLMKRCNTFILPVLLFYLFMCTAKENYAQIIEDTGQIFIEISNIISSMPGHSGNDYNDADTADLNSWGSIMDDIFAGNYAQADSIADSLEYDFVQFTDTSESVQKTYYILKSNGSNYWGTYVYNPGYCRPLVIQVPHPLKEINTGQQGIHVFQKTEALFFCLSGTSRCNHSSYSSCSGTTNICSGSFESYRISDMAHNVSSIFQKTTEKLLTGFSNTFFIQLHGFAKLVSDPYLIISNGTQVTPCRDYSALLQHNLLIEDTSLTFKIAHIDLNWTRLRAFDNTQGRLINSSTDACYANATATNGRFLSIEQERTKLRDDVTGWNKMANALINTFVCYPFLWDGSSGTDWNTAANWRGNTVPASSDNVTIANKLNNPAINEEPDSPAQCNNLEIQSEASLTINPGKALTVNGTLNNFGSLTIKSDAAGTGSLIHSTCNVNATVEQYLSQEKWHFIGMPVETDSAGVFYFPEGSDIYLRTHIESTNTWGDWIVSLNTPLILGRGYECWVDDNVNQDETVEFNGILNAGDYITGCGFYGLEYTTGHGLNLICNPYPSALQANISSWVKNNVANSVWTWSDAHGNYVYWGSGNNYGGEAFGTLISGVIPVMQAFFVEATGSSPGLTIPQSDRIHSSQAFYKDSEIPLNTLRFDVTGNGYEDAIFINLHELSTLGYDPDYDVEKLFGLNDAPQLYSKIQDKKLSINSLPVLHENLIVPVGFECGVSSDFKLSASGLEGFDMAVEFYLEDRKDGTIQNLRHNPIYSFTSSPLNEAERFLLHFENPAGVNQTILSSLRIYTELNEIRIVNLTNGPVLVSVFDLMGRRLVDKHLNGQNSGIINVQSGTGYYLVKIQTGDQFMTQKVFIK